jgi:uncharacterized membrane protein
MSPAVAIAGAWLLFAATHMGLSSPPVRTRLIAALGARGFQALYSAIALVIFVPLVGHYFSYKHAGDWLWVLERTPLLIWTVQIGMAVAFVLLVAGLLRPSPAGMIPVRDAQVRGIHRITRHPVLMSFALFGLLHLLPNGRTTDLAFFGGFALFTPLGCWHQDRRKLLADPRYAAFVARAPFFPFAGRESLRGLRELPPPVLALGLGATVLVRYFHSAWFG